MKKHTFYVFLLVVLAIPLILACSSTRPALAPESTNISSESMTTSATSTPTLTIKDGLPIFPLSASLPEYYDLFFTNAFIRLGLYEEALAEMEGEHILEIDAFTYLDTCLEISLHANAADVLPICEEAVEKFPKYEEALFTRAIARSKTGDYEGAISDFENFLEIISKPPENKYSPKNYAFETDIHLIECNIREWITVLKTGQNPITDQQATIIPSFKRIKLSLGQVDYDDLLIELEQLALMKIQRYDAVFNSVHYYFEGNYPPDINRESETDPEILQQDQIRYSITTDLYAYSTICLHGCFAGDINRVHLYCEQVDQIYESMPEFIDLDDRYSYLRRYSLSSGVYRVYQGKFDEAKTFFEDYLDWQRSSVYSGPMPDEILEEWIEKLENNEYPFQKEIVILLLQIFP